MELIFYALLAFVILFRLYSVLGQTKDDDVHHRGGKYIDATVEDVKKSNREIGNDVNQPISCTASCERDTALESKILDGMDAASKDAVIAMNAIDPGFNITNFIRGAEVAFEMVFVAYKNHNIELLNSFISNDLHQKLCASFTKAINKSIIIAFNDISIANASLHDSMAKIELVFHTDQIRLVEDEHGNKISGNGIDRVKVIDRWQLERNMKSSDPNWRLIDIR